jgi:p-hydroxybenzoate 3-monooxygenase
MRTQVAIVGAGPAGMFLAHLLKARRIDCVVIERHSRAYVEGRVRAGVLERITVDTLAELGLDTRLRKQGLVHEGINLLYDNSLIHIDLKALTGSSITVYGQQEVMWDLFDAADERGAAVVFDADDVALHSVNGDGTHVTWRSEGRDQRLDCEFVCGCDGFHGACRTAIPRSVQQTFERSYPFSWLGILADVPPANHELIYCNHANGFALATMRSATRSRYYLQCDIDEKIESWSDARFWDELCVRLGPIASTVTRGPSFEKSLTPLRSFVCEPLSFGRLFLAGDAAHIVPPAGAKGLNLAVSDVVLLADALRDFYGSGDEASLKSYSARALRRVWKAERFSWWFTTLIHRFPNMDAFARKMQLAELDYIRSSPTAQRSLAENYVGLPLER